MKASYRERKAVAEFDPQQVSAEQIARVINERTYYQATIASVTEGPFPSVAPPARGAAGPAVVTRLTVYVEGMRDDRAASRVLAAIGSEAVLGASADTSRSELTLVFDSTRLNASWFVDTINSRTPFRARLQATQPEGADRDLPALWLGAIAAGVAGGGILGWYALVRGRRKRASAPSSRQKQTGHR